MIQLSAQQREALERARAYVQRPDKPVHRLAGFAGTGKSTIAKMAVQGAPGRVMYMAPTGKAALVMSRKGCDGAGTIHSGIYVPAGEKLSERVASARREVEALDAELKRDDLQLPERRSIEERIRDLRRLLRIARDEARPMFTLNPASDLGLHEVWGALVDEASMIGSRVAADLLSFGKPVIALGDPAQLAPVRDQAWFGAEEPDSRLTEIHRQGANSGILRLSMLVREADVIPFGPLGDDCAVYKRGELSKDQLRELVVAADQVIVGRNATRRDYNARMRAIRGTAASGPYPAEGDRVVALKNSDNVLNGSVWTVEHADTDVHRMRTTMALVATDGTGERVAVESHAHYFVEKEEQIPHYEMGDADHFDYGYALTAHKSQGSEWDRVVVFDESAQFQHEWRQHLYTAVTRAAKHLVVVRP